MEILVLIILWLIAVFSAPSEMGAPLFFIFAALIGGTIVLRRKFKQLAEQYSSETAGLQKQLDRMQQELHLLRQSVGDATAGRLSSPPIQPIVPGPEPLKPVATNPPASSPIPAPPKLEPFKQPAVTPPAPSRPASPVQPKAPTPIQPFPQQPPAQAPLAARVSPPGQVPSYQQPRPPRPSAAQQMRRALTTIEETLGTNWLPKLGIFLVVIGIVSYLATQWQNIPPLGKDLLLLIAGGGLLGLGVYLERYERYTTFARVLIGGGWSILFFTAYALDPDHVKATGIIQQEWLDLLIMLATAGVMVWHTLRYKSQLVTGIAYSLAFSTVTISQETVYSLLAGVVLAASMVVLVQKMRWFELEVFGILASYLNHFRFLYPIISAMQGENHMFPQFYPSAALLIFYWAVFRISYVIRDSKNKHEQAVSSLAALLNPFLLIGLLKYQSVNPAMAFYGLLILGALEFTFGQLPNLRRQRIPFLILTTLGVTLMVASVPFKFKETNTTTVLWLAGAQALLAAGIITRELAFRRLGQLTALFTAAYVFVLDVWPKIEGIIDGRGINLDSRLGYFLIGYAAVFLTDAFILPRRWAPLFAEKWDRVLARSLAWATGITAFVALWITVPNPYVAIAWCALMFGFAVLGRIWKSNDLALQSTIVSLLTLVRLLAFNLREFNLLPNANGHIQSRIVTFSACAALFYASAHFVKFAEGRLEELSPAVRIGTQWAGTLMAILLIAYETPHAWTGAAFLVFAIVLASFARRLQLSGLMAQAYVVAALGFIQNILHNLTLTELYRPALSVRLVTIFVGAALFYALAAIARPINRAYENLGRGVFTSAAMTLITAVLWAETPEPWVPILLTLFALALLMVWRRFAWTEFRLQAHALSAISFGYVFVFNMNLDKPFHGISERLITVSITTVLLYAMTLVQWLRERTTEPSSIVQVYSWSASLLATTLMWHELNPVNVALGWTLFGLLLLEIGIDKHIPSLRWKAAVAFTASFIRIFYVNLGAIEVARKLSPRIYSIVPLAVIFLYAYWRLAANPELMPTKWRTRQLLPVLFNYFGTISLVTLVKFELDNRGELIAPVWAAIALALIAVGVWVRRDVFLHQSLLLTAATVGRVTFHDFSQGSYFVGNTSRLLTVSTTSALLLLGLPMAFAVRRQKSFEQLPERKLSRALAHIIRYPEQVFFFSALGLMTVLLFLQLHAEMITVAWGIEGVLVFLFALLVGERSFRLAGLALLMTCVGKLIFWDVWNLLPRDRYLSFIVLGAALLLVSFLYTRYREAIHKYL
jgi:hypothetical protein